jgi:DNA-directed RNA polymerase specialized sigma24 family protein
LDEIDQCLLRAKYVDGKSTKEIAEEEALTVKAVEHRLRRARRRLQALIG